MVVTSFRLSSPAAAAAERLPGWTAHSRLQRSFTAACTWTWAVAPSLVGHIKKAHDTGFSSMGNFSVAQGASQGG